MIKPLDTYITVGGTIVAAFIAGYFGVITAQRTADQASNSKQAEIDQATLFKAIDMLKDFDKDKTQKWATETIAEFENKRKHVIRNYHDDIIKDCVQKTINYYYRPRPEVEVRWGSKIDPDLARAIFIAVNSEENRTNLLTTMKDACQIDISPGVLNPIYSLDDKGMIARSIAKAR